jgi:hypothetical protein
LLKLVELFISQACWAVRLVAIDAEIAVLVPSNDSLASGAFAGCAIGIRNDHLTVFAPEELFHENGHLILLDGS